MPRKNGSRAADAELLGIREHRKKLVETLHALSHLLEEYTPSWYSEEYRKLAAAALSAPRKLAAGR